MKTIVIPGPNFWGKDPVVITPKGIFSVGKTPNFVSILRKKKLSKKVRENES